MCSLRTEILSLNPVQNLLLSSNDENSNLKIADFGFARHVYFILRTCISSHQHRPTLILGHSCKCIFIWILLNRLFGMCILAPSQPHHNNAIINYPLCIYFLSLYESWNYIVGVIFKISYPNLTFKHELRV